MRSIVGVLLFAATLSGRCETIGKRPYEMDWAGRTEDDHPPLVNFEDLSGWRVETSDAEANFGASREQQLWGNFVGKLTYRGTGAKPLVRVLPPSPIRIDESFDAVTCWIYGNNIAGRDKTTPPVTVSAELTDSQGKPFSVAFKTVAWKEWFLCHRRLTPDAIDRVKDGASFTGLTIRNGRNKDDRVLYLDNLAFFTEEFPSLTFEPRAKRGVSVFPGRDTGLNTGPGKLPFPVRPETIIPTSLAAQSTVAAAIRAETLVLTYKGDDGTMVAEVPADTCMWDGIRLRWDGHGDWVRPCVGGGPFLVTDAGKPRPPSEIVLKDVQRQDDGAVCTWTAQADGTSATVKTRYWLSGKSLVIDVSVVGEGETPGAVGEVRFGAAAGFANPRLVTVPYYTYGQTARPAVVVAGSTDEPLFFMGHVDWTLSNASEPWAENRVAEGQVTYNGGTRYHPKTDGRRNPCYERFVLSLSPRFEEVLPNIPNPVSPWKHVTGTRVWRAHGASDRQRDAAYWRKVHRYGMTEVVVTDHETGWRDGEESFTFRTRPAPGKGGDKGQYDYARIMQDELGFVYGPYNNFTDFAPVNEFWSLDLISRTRDNQLQTAWRRCYAPKPARAVEFCAKLPPIIEEKFHFSTAYCDVHTAVTPWSRTDYDCRVPGAGTFAAVYYAFGEIMLLQKKAWDGPVYSEGNNHFPYCGLTDGNYAQDQRYGLPANPWLVDFDLLKMHDLCCNFGMGNPGMFFGRNVSLGSTREEVDASVDRFLAATVAFGHPGFLMFEGGYQNALRSYYMLQQLHSRYTLGSAATIRYVSVDGSLLDTSGALASGDFRRSQIVTRYSNGCTTVVNGSRSEWLGTEVDGRKITLPPNGYQGWTDDGTIEVFSGEQDGRRVDYAVTPAYLYADGRGRFTRFAKAASDGIGICRILPADQFEIIPYEHSDCGFAIEASRAEALDEKRDVLGPAEVRQARGLTYVVPVEGAFSYRLYGGKPSDNVALRCSRDRVIPGEAVQVRGQGDHTFTVATDAAAGQRLWQEFEGSWIDFTVVELCDLDTTVTGSQLRITLTPNTGKPTQGTATIRDVPHPVELRPGEPVTLTIDLGTAERETIETLALDLEAGPLRQSTKRTLIALAGHKLLAEVPSHFEIGKRLRGEGETALGEGYGGGVYRTGMRCGDVQKDALRIHPPYKKGVGYTFALLDELTIPEAKQPTFRAFVGKGDGSDPGDGILYKLAVVEAGGKETVVAEQHVVKHEWLPLEADLTKWVGQAIRLKLITDVGEADNSSGDWGCWAEMRLEERELSYQWALAGEADAIEAGPFPLSNVTDELLRSATKGWLHYDGAGLEGKGNDYATYAVLNEVELGPMERAGGDPANGVWAEDLRVPLTDEAIATLTLRNQFRLQNPAEDWFKVRRFWLELEFADGTKGSSALSTTAFTQPPNWPYAEGIGVPHGREIEVNLWFP